MDFTTQARFEQRFVVVGMDDTERDLATLTAKAKGLTDAAEGSAARLPQGAAAASTSMGAMGAAAVAAAHTAGTGLDEIIDSLDSVDDSADTAGSSLERMAMVAGLALGAIGMKALADEAAAGAYEIQKLSWEMGITVEQADTLGDAMLAAGVTGEATGAAMARWAAANRLVSEGAGELPKEMEAWGKLGKEALSNFPEALARVSEEIARASSEQQKMLIANAYFGEAGRKLLPLLTQGPEALREAASGMGAFYNADIVRRSNDYRVHMLQAADAIGDMKTTVAVELYPLIERIADRALPLMKLGAEATAGILKFAADNAAILEAALAGAAIHMAAMSVSSGGGMIARLLSLASSPTAIAAGVAAGGAALFSYMAEDLNSAANQGGSDWWGDAQRMAEAAQFQARLEQSRADASRSATKAAEQEADALRLLAKVTALTGDQIKGLGYSAIELVGDFQSGGRAIRIAGAQARNAGLTERIAQTDEELELLRAAAKAAPIIKAMRAAGQTYEDIERGFAKGEAAARERAAPGAGGSARFSDQTEINIEASKLAIKTLRLAEMEAERGKLTKLLEAGKPLVQNTFNGPINNSLDLRGEDPDRVIFAVTDGLARMAAQRTSSRFTPVGL